jgi:hypothetical protein
MRTFAGEKIVVWISVPGNMTSFEMGIFDGDSGRDDNGASNWTQGNWDDETTPGTYTLYADPLKNNNGGAGSGLQVGQWLGNDTNSSSATCTVSAPTMPNNAWYTITCSQVPQAQGPNGHYFYRLEVTQPIESYGGNAFKLRSTGYLSTGRLDLVNASFAIVGQIATIKDVPILYPQYGGSLSNAGPSNYTGDWAFKLFVPNSQTTLEFWNGDFDRGTSPSAPPADTDDPNTTGKPPWAGPFCYDEGVGGNGTGIGAPADDYFHPIYRRTPPVIYEIVDPNGVPIYTDDNPSGTEEWEDFIVSTSPTVTADLLTDSIPEGFYTWHIIGLDAHNLVFIRTNMCIADQPFGCTSVWYEGDCPRTIGYWKNNVKKVLIEGRTRGVQESVQTLEWGLRNVALASPLFRHGINVQNPVTIADPVPLTAEEADMILQRDKGTYPGGRDAANSMLARALPQNLAAWLNLATGKVGPTTIIELPAGYQGTLWDALQTAQDIILNRRDDAAALEYAKNIGDQINNGLLGEDAATSVCQDYVQLIPPGKQPKKFNDMPEAPTPVPPPPPVASCTSDQDCPVCSGNPCDSIFSPGYWKNYSNHYTDEEFLALIQKTMHYSGLTIDEALAILDNNADQYHRHLLSAELNVAADPGLGVGTYNSGSIGGALVLQVLDLAYNADPASAGADLTDAVLYLGAEGEGQGDCRVGCAP